MKNNILYTIFLLTLAANAFAAPAKHTKRTLTLADGSHVEATLTGNEHAHWYVDANGGMLTVDSLGIASYMDKATLAKKKSVGESRAKSIEKKRSAHLAKTAHSKLTTRAKGAQKADALTSTQKGLVILVNYKDNEFNYARDDFNSMANEKGYSKNGCIGSVSDYFRDQSYGQFDLEFDVVGPYTLSHSMSYYGKNDRNGEDLLPGTMIAEACTLADADVNFANYDWDGDGEVEQVYVIFAGYCEEQGGSSNSIWSHEWTLDDAHEWNSSDGNGALTLDGVTVNTYACSSELMNDSGTTMVGIGTMCHEFSHCLGLPDEYDTEGDNFGMDIWSIMDYGEYGCDGYVPTGYTSYERWMAGWLTPTELTDNCEVNDMKAITDSPEAYIIYNNANSNEYYLLENRQQTSWDKGTGGHGMLVLHVDYDEKAWEELTINNTASHQRLTIIAADNSYLDETLSGDPYPGTSYNTELSSYSVPAAKLYNKNTDGTKLMNRPITNISENNGLISFTFTNPDAAGIEEIESNGEATTSNKGSNKLYSLTGQYLGTDQSALPHGLYIQNGQIRIHR